MIIFFCPVRALRPIDTDPVLDKSRARFKHKILRTAGGSGYVRDVANQFSNSVISLVEIPIFGFKKTAPLVFERIPKSTNAPSSDGKYPFCASLRALIEPSSDAILYSSNFGIL